MRNLAVQILYALLFVLFSFHNAAAAPAVEVLGKDHEFPNKIEGFPAKLSDFKGLQISSFVTSDGVKLAYWEAGEGRPLIFIPGWSANGAEYVNVLFLLSKHYHVYVLDPRNQGLSQRVEFGMRISRFSVDLKEFADHLGLKQADYCGWSMGASVLWGYIDLFGTKGIRKVVFVDEPISIVAHADWSEQERKEAGAFVAAPEPLIAALNQPPPANPSPDDISLPARSVLRDSPYFANSEEFANSVIKNDPNFLKLVMYDHLTNDWRDVIRHKINVPTAIFSGEYSNNLPSQRWMASVIPGATLYSYTKKEQGDHFLMFKNPIKFTNDLRSFLER